MTSPRSRLPLAIGIGIVVGVACLALVVVLILAITAGGFLFWRNSGIGTEPAPPDDGQVLALPPGAVEGEALLPAGCSERAADAAVRTSGQDPTQWSAGELFMPGSPEETIAAG